VYHCIGDGLGKSKVNVWSEAGELLDSSMQKVRKQEEGAMLHSGARKEWNNIACAREMDVTIEDLLRDDYYLGEYNIWPSIMGELEEIWHRRCDFDVHYYRDTESGKERIKQDSVYALSYEHAKRKSADKWPGFAEEATEIDVRRANGIHTVCIECPKGTGKNFESALIIWLLTREFLIQDRVEFFSPYNLDLGTTIAIITANRTEQQAREVTFKEILPKMLSPFFLDYFPPQVDLEEIEQTRRFPRELRFPRNVVIFPGTGSAASGLGYCVGASIIDEANFLAKSSTGKQSIMGSDTYDAAAETYADLFQRMESRFGAIRHGEMAYAGISTVISSSRTHQDFTQEMLRRSKTNKGIFYSRLPFWDRKPLDLSGETFEFDVANMQVLNPNDAISRKEKLSAMPEGMEAD
jgi:hypothetical protein